MVIGLLLKDNKVHKFGEIVDEDQLTSPSAALVAGKFIEPVAEAPAAKPAKTKPADAPATPAAPAQATPEATAPAPTEPAATPTPTPATDAAGPNPLDILKGGK